MRTYVSVVIAAGALFLAGCCTTPHASKWEYKVASPQRAFVVGPEDAREAKQAFLNDLGKEGWLLVQVDGMNFYFKRPVK